MKKIAITIISFLALSTLCASAALTAAEIEKIESAFGITLSTNQIQDLDAVVNPTNTAAWRSDAYTRIEQHRKADLDIQVVDANGDPVEGAQVSVQLKKNAFKFGGVLSVEDLTDANGSLSAEGSTSNDWQRITTNLFNAAGLNNGFKPKITGQHEYIPGFLDWAATNNLSVRGHLLMWPGGGSIEDLDGGTPGTDYGDHLSTDSTSAYASYDVLGAVTTYAASARGASDKATLKTEVDAEIAEWASQWNVYEWDVINETVGNTLLQEILGYDQMAEWFKIAETNKVSSDTGLYINEFKIISADYNDADDQYNTRKDTYTNRINAVIADGGPITGIGFQSRFKYGHISPETVYNRLDEFATLYPNLTLAGTEFEMKDGQDLGATTNVYDELTRAQMTEEILTTYFSHDQVIGLNAWDFMSATTDVSEEKTAALAWYDGTIKLNGLAWYYLHRIRYNTDATLSSGLDGQTGLRAFKGDYDVSVSYKGQTVDSTLTLSSNQTLVITLNSVVADDPNTTAVIDAWNYDGLADGAALSSAVSTGAVGGVSVDDNKGLSSIQNEAVRWQSDGVSDSLYKNIVPSSYVGASNGLFQLSMDYLDADFSASAVVSNGSGRVALGIRDDVAGDANFRLVFDSGGGSAPEFRLEVTDELNNNQAVATFPGSTLDHLSVRAVYDFDNAGSAGSYKVYYRLDGGSEAAAHTTGQLPTGFALDQLRLVVQTFNGGVNWQAGDRIYTDNMILRSLGEAPPVFFTVDPISKPSGSNDVAYTGQSIAGTATNALSYSKVAGPAWLTIASNGDLSGTPTGDDVGQNSWIVQASNGNNTDTAVLSIFVNGSGAGGPGSDISIVSGPTTDNDDSVTGEMEFANVSVLAGDVVAIATSPNKGADVNHMALQWSGTTGVDGTLTTVESDELSNRSAYLFYVEIDNPGSYTFTVVPETASLTAQSSLFVLRANSGIIQVADTTIFAQNTSAPGLAYDFSPITLSAGIAVEAFASIGGTSLTLDENYSATQNANGRNIAYSTLVSGSSWNKPHASDAGTQDYVGAGAVFYEQTSGGGNAPPVFATDPVSESSAESGTAYTGSTLADNASDADSDPLNFFKVSGPAWLTVATNGVLSGTPASGDLGTNSWKVSVTDGAATNFATLEIDVIQTTPPPPIASPDRDRMLPTNTYNVLFIAIDDMRPLIDAYGETDPLRPITPNMDRLAASGVMFANAYCQQAVCNASRASLLTGLRPDTTMCWKLETLFRTKLPDVITLPQHFGANGYRVHGIGKIYHSTNAEWQDDPLSWNEDWASSNTGYTWYETDKAALEDAGTNSVSATDAGVVNTRDGNRPIIDEDYNDGYAAAQGVAKITEYADSYQTNGTPFFLAVGFQKPHMPFNAPKTYWDLYNPAQIDLTGYTGIRQMPVGSNKFTAPYGGEPSAFLDITGTIDNNMPNATEARHLIHGYLACVSFIDTQIGKLLDALEDPDGNPGTDDSIADNTIIVLWGDHGFHLGDHNGFWAKHSNYEISTRVPLIIKTPGLEALGAAGSRSVGLVELVDIYPTLLDLCSLPAPAQPPGQELQGTTFLPLLEDPDQPWKKAVFSQFQRVISDNEPGDVPVANSGGGMGYSVRTERYRYTEWWVTDSTDETDRHIIKAGITEPGHIELYDYVADPGETTNLAANVSYSNLVAELSALLNDPDAISAGDGWALPETDAPVAYPVDSNVWKTNYLTPGRTLSELDFNNDPDGDGLVNRFEYKFGTHPFEADTPAVLSGFENNNLYVTYPDVESRTNVLLETTSATNLLGTWSGTGVTTTNEGQFGNATIKTGSVPSDDPQRFLRLEATDQ